MMMDAIYFFPFLTLLLLIGVCIRITGLITWIQKSNRMWAFACLAAHLFSGLGLYWLYARILPDPGKGDVLKYLLDAGFLNEHLPSSGWWKVLSGIGSLSEGEQRVLEQIDHWELSGASAYLNEGRTLIRLHMILLPFTRGFWGFHVCFFAFVSWLGAAWLAKAGERLLPKGSPAWMPWVIGASPSWMFWSSGMLKESLVAFGLGLLTLGLTSDGRARKKAAFLMGAFIIFFLSKLYLLPLSLVASGAGFLMVFFRWRAFWAMTAAFGVWICFLLFPASSSLEVKQRQFLNLASGGFFIERTHDGLMDTLRIDASMEDRLLLKNGQVSPRLPGIMAISWVRLKATGAPFLLLQKKNESWRLLSALKPAGSRFSIPEWKSGDTFHNLKSMPEWLLNSFTRPWPNQCRGVLDWVNLMESWLLLLVWVWSLVYFKPTTHLDSAATVMCLVWCLALGLLVGIATPVVGALVRYRAPMHPAIILLFLRAWRVYQTPNEMVNAP